MVETIATIKIGRYEVSGFEDKSLWIKNIDGEGMSVADNSELMKNLENLIHMFFNEHF